MKNLLLAAIGFTLAFSVQAQSKKQFLKIEEEKNSTAEVVLPDNMVISGSMPQDVNYEGDFGKHPKVNPAERVPSNEDKVKQRGDSQKPIYERGKGKPEHVREKQKNRHGNKDLIQVPREDKVKSAKPGQERKEK